MTADGKIGKLSEEQVNSLLGAESSQNGADKIKILIVEDDTSTQLLYEKGLFNKVFDKKIIASGKEALLVYKEWHPDIVMLDIQMPEMNGGQILKEIRTNIGDKKTTIVMATSKSSSDDVKTCMKLGIEGYIVKPFSLREIGEKILSYYAKKEPERTRKAYAACRDILKQAPIRLLLDKDESMDKEDKKVISKGTADKKTEAAAEEKPKDCHVVQGTPRNDKRRKI
jgi:DNA-binding response OmpR family regulator